MTILCQQKAAQDRQPLVLISFKLKPKLEDLVEKNKVGAHW